MVRNTLLLGLSLLCSCLLAQKPTEERPTPSTIVSATVYLEGAQVNRTARATLPAGRSTLVFTGLTARLDASSIQLSSNDRLTILSVNHRLNFRQLGGDAGAKNREVTDRIAALDRAARRLHTRAAIDREEEAILQANRQIAGTDGVDAADLERAVRFQRERIAAIRLGYLAIEDSLTNIADQRELLQTQLAEAGRAEERPARAEVVVKLDCPTPLTAEFNLAYLVPEAGWTPRYDARVTDISQPVDLRYRARVHQESGEDWADVRLTLSTGDPSQGGQRPELATWRLANGLRPPTWRPSGKRDVQFGYRTVTGVVTDEEKQALIGATVVIQGTDVGTVTDVDGNFSLDVAAEHQKLNVSYTGYQSKTVLITPGVVDVSLEPDAALLDEVVVIGYGGGITRSNRMQRRTPGRVRAARKEADALPVPVRVERRATTTAFDIELPYTIPSDGKPYDVAIRQFTIPATYEHYAVPKYSPDVFLTAALTDWEQYDLISGEMQLFFEGTYLGDSYLDVANTSDTLELSLGRDPGVIVTRTANADYRRRGGTFGGRRSERRGWALAVRNTKAQPIRLTLLDQAPVSGQSNVDVDTDLPDGVHFDGGSGRLKWELTLAPRQEWRTEFGYTVKFPRGEAIYVE